LQIDLKSYLKIYFFAVWLQPTDKKQEQKNGFGYLSIKNSNPEKGWNS